MPLAFADESATIKSSKLGFYTTAVLYGFMVVFNDEL